MISKEEFETEYFLKRKKIAQIAKERNVPKAQLYLMFKKFGFKVNTKPSKETLTELYIKQKKSIKEVGRMFNRHPSTVSLWLASDGIPTRPPSEIHYKGTKPSRDELKKLYVDEHKSTRQIGRICGADKVSIRNWLRKYKIPIRDGKTFKWEVKGIKMPSKEVLEGDYKTLSLELIAKKYKVSVQAILTLFNRYKIKTRNRSEARKLALGIKRVVSWNKGLSMDNPRVAKMINHLHKIHMEKINQSKLKQADTLKKLFKEGKLKVWNKGLTKKDDPRIAASSDRLRLLRLGKDPLNKKEVPPKEILEELYIRKNQSLEEVAIQFSTNQSTVMRWLEKYGVKRRKPISGRRGKEVVCKDGDRVRSSGERVIDDWLSGYGIKHRYESIIAYAKFDQNKRVEYKYVKPDFEVSSKKGVVYVEYYGMENNKIYREKMIQKRRFYELQTGQFNINLIELWPKDLHNLNQKLGFLIPIASKKQSTL